MNRKYIFFLTTLFFFTSFGIVNGQNEQNLRVKMSITDEAGKLLKEYDLSHFSYYFSSIAQEVSEKQEKTIGFNASLAQAADEFFFQWVSQERPYISGKITILDVEKREELRTLEFTQASISNLDESYVKGLNYRNGANFMFFAKTLKINGQVILE